MKSPLGYGTVGCAALDINGDLAAGTSTGGKRFKFSCENLCLIE